MRTLTTYADADSPEHMAAQLCVGLSGERPIGGILYASARADVTGVLASLRAELGDVPLIGCTSCLGPATGQRFTARRDAVSVMWMLGEGFQFGSAAVADSEAADLVAAGEQLANRALARAGLDAARVRFAVFHATPGGEEAQLEGVQRVLPDAVVLLGGSAADDDLSGQWRVWTEQGVLDRGATLAVCDWPWKLGMAFRSGYLPSPKTAVVTRANGRMLYELDGRPAVEVYDEWLGGALADERHHGGQVLGKTTLAPLGVARAKVAGTDSFVLVHPERVVVDDGALALFATVREGERVTLMHCTERGLVRRSRHVAQDAMRDAGLQADQLAGALMIYCGGCVLPIEDRMHEMLAELRGSLGDTPVVSAFTFGEQGTVIPRRVEHGNLMASVLLLSTVDEAA